MKPVVDLANEVLWHWKTFPIILPPPIETKIEPAAGKSCQSKMHEADRKYILAFRNEYIPVIMFEMKQFSYRYHFYIT